MLVVLLEHGLPYKPNLFPLGGVGCMD